MADATVRGRFVWHDLLTPNPAGAHEFYGKVLGWKKQAWDQDPSYEMFAAPSGPIGGTVDARAVTPHWLPYIGTTDVDATLETATGLGARVVSAPEALPNGGRYATLADPQGATFGIHASSAAHGPETAPQFGEFSWHELATNVAPGVAFGFYAQLFAWDEITQYDMGPMGMYLIFGRNGKQLGGMFDKGSEAKPGSAYWLGYVSVKDLEGTIERAKTARGSVLTGPMDVPGGDRIATLMDPHGTFFALHRPAVAAKAAAQAPAKAGKPAKAAAPAPAKASQRPKAAAPAPKKPVEAAAPKKASAPKKSITKKSTTKKKPAKKAAPKNRKPVARKAAKTKSPAKKSTSRKTAKKGKSKAKRGR